MKEEQLPFENEDYRQERVRNRKIKEILEQESILKRERQKLISEKPWYKKPEIIIAVFGIIFPIIASYLIASWNNDTKELTVTYSAFEPIISESNNFKGNLSISYDSSAVNNISKLTLKIKNTGNVSLAKSDFVDGPINVQITYGKNNTSTILQVNKKNDANQQNSVLTYTNSNHISSIRYLPSLLNKGDEIIIEAYFLDTPSTKMTIIGKLLNGNIIGPKPIETKETKIGFKTFVQSLNSFFTYKWISIAVMIIIFIFTALSSLFQFAMVSEKDVDPPGLVIVMGIITSLISVFSIVLIISILIYV